MRNFLLLFVFSAFSAAAQSDSIWQQAPTLQLSGGLDVFYVYDFSKPTDGYRAAYLYNHNRHNEFNLNLGYAKLAVSHPKYRSNFALHAGTYVQDNYANEPEILRFVSEANIGFALNKKNTLWLDAGIFPSYIGFESAFSSQNATMTRSLLAENSPYFVSGAKLGYAPNSKLEINLLVLNGWQRIARQINNSLPAFGTQLKYSPNANFTFNWSTFFGSEYPDNLRRYRFFSNLYATWQSKGRLSLTAGFDIGTEQDGYRSEDWNIWLSPVVIAQLKVSDRWKMAFRGEYYRDKSQTIVDVGYRSGFEVFSASVNADFSPNDRFMARLEARFFSAAEPIFEGQYNNFVLGGSLVAYFSRQLTNN